MAGGAGIGAPAAGAQRGPGRGARRRCRCAESARRGRRPRRQRHGRTARRPWRRPTPAISSAATRRASATGGRCCSARCSTSTVRRRDLHLKGSGRTPFARGGDGKAAVGPMLREYVIGEAMHALGIPTTRALAVVATGDEVARETMLPGAVLVRVAASHLRVGTFQYAARNGDLELVRRLADYAIARHHPHALDAPNPYLAFLRGRRRGPGSADRALDARRVHPRRHEHRQHDDLRRDHRLRPVRVHGLLRPRDGVQLDRPRRPLRLRQPAPGRAVEPGAAGRDAAAAGRLPTRRRRSRRPAPRLESFADHYHEH